MALTISQVNQGFLALFGRPATGAEATKFAGQADVATLANALLVDPLYTSELTASFPKIKTVDLNAATDDAFIESLYQALIGRASDAEGKTYWLGVKAAGATREEVLAQFEAVLKEQATQGTADGVAYENIMSEDTSLVSAWVETLYQNLAARASDVEGLNYWTTQAIQNGGAAVVAAFAASLAAQGNTTEDGQNFAQKQGVADAFTNAFKDFNSIITANEKALVLGNLHTMMDGVNKDSQLDQYTEEVIKIVDEYQNIKAVQFTKADDDDLGINPETGESNLNSAANFTGTYNLTDETKGTIQSSDRATGTEAYLTDTLSVNVTGYDKDAHPEFDLNNLPGTTSVEKLIINNGAASVTGSIGDDFQYVNVKGTGGFTITASKDLADVVLNSGSSKDGEYNVFNGLDVTSLKTAAGNDHISVGTVEKSLNTGAGNDDVTATLGKGATADLGAGDDTFTGFLNANASLAGGAGDDTLKVTGVTSSINGKAASTIEIDGGTGKDTLDLSTSGNTNFQGIKSVKGVEALTVGTNTKLMASAISGQKLTLDGASLVLNAKGANGVDLSKMVNAEGADVAVRVENVKSGNVNLAYGNKDFNNLKETIVLAKDASKVSIKGFEQGNDHIEIDGAKVSNANFFNVDGSINANAVAADNIYFVDLKEKVTKAAINDLLKLQATKFDKTKIGEKDAFYIVATDLANGNNSTAKVYKIEVGKDGTVGKLDQISTISVADKDILNKDDFQSSPNYAQTVYASGDGATIDISGMGNVKIPGVAADGTKLTKITISGGNETQDVTVKTAAGQNVAVDVTSSVKSITTDAGNDTVKVAAGQTVETINTGAGNDKIDISATTTSNIKNVDGGAGSDTLIISGDTANTLKSMSSIEKIEIKGTSISAEAITTNAASEKNLTTALANVSDADTVELTVVAPTVAAGSTGYINLTNLAQATDDNGAVTLNITDVKANTTVNLTTIGNKAATSTASAVNGTTETVNLATGAKNVTIKNIFDGDKVSGADISGINGSGANSGFQGLKAEGVSIVANGAYYTNAAIAASDYSSLTSGDKVLVAVNSGNQSVLHLITKTTNGITDVALATVDNVINGADTVASGLITFSSAGEPEKPATGSTVNYTDLPDGESSDKVFTDGGKYPNTDAGKVIDIKTATDNTVNIQGVSGALTIKAKAETVYTVTDKVNVEASGDVSFAVTATELADATVTLKLDNNRALSEKSTASLSNVDVVQLNGTNALALDQVSGATLKLGTTVGTDSATVDTNKGEADLSNITKASTDAVKVTLSNVENNITLSAVTNLVETLAIGATISDKTITAFETGVDKLNIKAIAGSATSIDTVEGSRATEFLANKVFITDQDLGSISANVTTEIVNLFKEDSAFVDNGEALLIGTSGGTTKIYKITGDNGGTNKLDTADTIALLATIDSVAVATGDFTSLA